MIEKDRDRPKSHFAPTRSQNRAPNRHVLHWDGVFIEQNDTALDPRPEGPDYPPAGPNVALLNSAMMQTPKNDSVRE